MKRWPELRERLLDLADTLRDHGIVWKPFVELGAEVRRGSRIPGDVAAEMRGLLEDLRAIARPTPANWEERELGLAAAMDVPVWGFIRFVEPGEPGEYELPVFSDLPVGDGFGRGEPTAEQGFMALWRLVLAWESGALEGTSSRGSEEE